MSNSRDNFTSAIAWYLEHNNTDVRVNMYSMATRLTYTRVVNDANVKRSELNDDELDRVSMVEDLAAAYISLQRVHPVEAVELAYQEIVARDGEVLSVLFKKTALPYENSKHPHRRRLKRQAILALLKKTPLLDNVPDKNNEPSSSSSSEQLPEKSIAKSKEDLFVEEAERTTAEVAEQTGWSCKILNGTLERSTCYVHRDEEFSVSFDTGEVTQARRMRNGSTAKITLIPSKKIAYKIAKVPNKGWVLKVKSGLVNHDRKFYGSLMDLVENETDYVIF